MKPPQFALDLAARLGARADGEPARVVFAQRGTLRQPGAEKWMRFRASQWMDIQRTAFAWRAQTGPLGAIRVTDALSDGRAAGGVSLLGVLRIAKAKSNPALIKAQLMRYLAELPWAPDAILHNPTLEWIRPEERSVRVATQSGGVRGEVTFALDDQGLPASVTGLRPCEEGGGFQERPWGGLFEDFRKVQGRLIPHRARVAWTLDGARCEVWRGTLAGWRMERLGAAHG